MPTALDEDSRTWLQGLTADGKERQGACDELYRYLLCVARGEVGRRAFRLHLYGPELEDLAHQAAADSLLTIMAKLSTFRGEARFTTWAYKFAVFDVATKINRHFWRRSAIPFDVEDWGRLPARFGIEPDVEAEARDLLDAVQRAADDALSPRQRFVFVAIVLNGMPMDVLADQLGSTHNTIYKIVFDARRKLRRALVADGYLARPPLS